jgi:hypothetical protein
MSYLYAAFPDRYSSASFVAPLSDSAHLRAPRVVDALIRMRISFAHDAEGELPRVFPSRLLL